MNRGNLVIEESLLHLIATPPRTTVSAFTRPSDDEMRALARCDLLLCPGATLFDVDDHLNVCRIAEAGPPVVCASGAFMCEPGSERLDILESLAAPVGTRDSFSHSILLGCGKPATRTGCPSVSFFINRPRSVEVSGRASDRLRVLFSFGRGDTAKRTAVARLLRQHTKLVSVTHEEWHEELDRLSGTAEQSVRIASVAHFADLIDSADVIVTGRLHMLLPALAWGKPAIFFAGDTDSRHSLLEELGIPILPENPDQVMDATLTAVAQHRSGSSGVPDTLGHLDHELRRFLGHWGLPLAMAP